MLISRTWRLEALIPAEHAIGGVSFWTPLRDAEDISTLEAAQALFARARPSVHKRGALRIVRVELHDDTPGA